MFIFYFCTVYSLSDTKTQGFCSRSSCTYNLIEILDIKLKIICTVNKSNKKEIFKFQL